MASSDDIRNVFSSPRATPYLPSKHATHSAEAAYGLDYRYEEAHAMHIHYNNDYQPHHMSSSSRMHGHGHSHAGSDLHDRYFPSDHPASPDRNSLSVLAETTVASAEKEHNKKYVDATPTVVTLMCKHGF
jgi:hypothetical protein